MAQLYTLGIPRFMQGDQFTRDDEYPAYLKKQSYDDLISISYSIDKEVAAKRYAMVLAEIAERDKRGEGKSSKPKPRYWPIFTVGTLAALCGLFSVLTGSAGTKNHHIVYVTENPTGFWILVGIDFAAAAICFILGILKIFFRKL